MKTFAQERREKQRETVDRLTPQKNQDLLKMDQIALLPNCILLLTDGAGSKRRVRSWHGLVNSHQVDWTWNLSTGA